MTFCSTCSFMNLMWTSMIICAPPPTLENGIFVGPLVPYPGTVYQYSCNEGFMLTGSNAVNLEVACQENGNYTLDASQMPLCELGCEKPGLIENGGYDQVLNDSYSNGAMLTWYCKEGYSVYPQDESNIIECQTGAWTSPKRACLAECPALPQHNSSLFNVEYSYEDDRMLETTKVHYYCNESHEFSWLDVNEIVCRENGTWSHDYAPLCLAVCETAPEIKNGVKNVLLENTIQNGSKIEKRVEYSCLAGYIMTPIENKILECKPGWHPASPAQCLAECPMIPTYNYSSYLITNEVTIYDKMAEGTEVVYTCDQGHVSSSPSALVSTCDSNGSWGQAIDCLPYCGQAPELIGSGNKTVIRKRDTDFGFVELEVMYECDAGFVLDPPLLESNVVTCNPGGNWSQELPLSFDCSLVCPEPAIDFGWFNISIERRSGDGELLWGSLVDYGCDEGFVMGNFDSTLAECQADGTYDSDEPICFSDCPPAPEIYHGTKNVTRQVFVYGETVDEDRYVELEVEYSCDTHHHLIPPYQSSWKCDTGAWNYNLTNQCLVACDSPAHIDNGYYEISKPVWKDQYLDGVEVTYFCNQSSFIYHPTVYQKLFCMSDSLWSFAPGQCSSYCGEPQTIEGGMSEVTESVYVNATFSISKRVSYSCPGKTLHPAGKDDWICDDKGKWNHESVELKCLSSCSTPSASEKMIIVENQIQPGSYLQGTTLDVSCEANYVLSDYRSNSILCQADGSWSDELPVCVRNCGNGEVLYGTTIVISAIEITTENGTVSLPQTISYTCDPGFDLIPSQIEKQNCSENGYFGEGPISPTCVKECSSPPSYNNSEFNLTVQLFGTRYYSSVEVTYICNDGYTRAGTEDSTLTCNFDGNWLGSVGECRPICAPASFSDVHVIKTISSSLVVNESLTLEQSVQWHCPSDRVLIPPVPEWTCENGPAWSSSVQPTCLLECSKPPHIRHGSITSNRKILPGRYITGTEISYECEEYYMFINPNETAFICQENGSWNMTQEPQCVLEWSDVRQCNASFNFFYTENLGNFTSTRSGCMSKDSHLFHEQFSFEPQGTSYHEFLRNLTGFDDDLATHIYVGVINKEGEGFWRYIDGTLYDWTLPVDQISSWIKPKSLESIDSCMEIVVENLLDDVDCGELDNYGLCEKKDISCVYP